MIPIVPLHISYERDDDGEQYYTVRNLFGDILYFTYYFEDAEEWIANAS